MADEKKTTDDNEDPADAFARVSPEDTGSPPPRNRKRKGNKNAPREPAIETALTKAAPAPEDDEGMDPFDAATEILGLLDRMMAAAVALRGYGNIMMPDGVTPIVSLVLPDEAAKERTKKALVRVMKSTGATLSPGAGLALSGFLCYGAPIITLEIAKAGAKKALT